VSAAVPPHDLAAAAREAAHASGFAVALPPDAAAELAHTLTLVAAGTRPPNPQPAPPARDLRDLPWSSVDNPESRDLDQVEVAEALGGGATRLRIGLADVDALVPRGGALDRHAADNTVSLYAGATVLPMLPDALSGDRTSLHEGGEREALVVELTVDADGAVHDPAIYAATLVNRARLAYDEVAAWLDGAGPLPAAAARVPEVAAQLRLQDDAARRLRAQRARLGALELETIEARPVIVDGQVVDLALAHKSRARELIEDFMIAANSAMARVLEREGVASIRRVVRAPERWDRIVALARPFGVVLPGAPDAPALAGFLRARRAADPAGFAELSLAVVKLLGPGEYVVEDAGDARPNHFGLAVQDYTHGTAPNRRYADLVTQRLLKHVLARAAAPSGAPDEVRDGALVASLESCPYTRDALVAIAARCTERENAARAVERTTRKQAAASLLAGRVGEAFDAVVTGVKASGVFVRALAPPVEGRLVDVPGRSARDRNVGGPDVGDRLRVRLQATDPAQGFVDFVRA
jgi:exoribonuclease-2